MPAWASSGSEKTTHPPELSSEAKVSLWAVRQCWLGKAAWKTRNGLCNRNNDEEGVDNYSGGFSRAGTGVNHRGC